MQWMMLQQDHAGDFVIATGKQHSVRQLSSARLVNWASPLNGAGPGVDDEGRRRVGASG